MLVVNRVVGALEVSPGKRLASFRNSLKLSQKAFAQSIGFSGGLVGQLEADLSPPSRSFLQKLSEVYGVSSDWLLNGRGSMFSEGEAQQVPARQVYGAWLFECAGIVESEYENAGLDLEAATHYDETSWCYNEAMSRMTNPTDKDEFEAILPQIRLLLRRKLGLKR